MSIQRTQERSATAEVEQANECPECDGDVRVIGNEEVCQECGLVVDEDRIDLGPEWRAFSQSEKEKKSRVGGPTTNTMHDKGLTTVIGNDRVEIFENVLGERKREQLDRMKKWDRRSKQTGKERGLKFLFSEIHRMSSELNLPHHVREEAAIIIREASNENYIKGRSYEGMATAALLISSRKTDNPITLSEATEISWVSRQKIRGSMRKLRRELDIQIPPLSPTDVVDRLLHRLRSHISDADDFHEFKKCTWLVVEDVVDANLHSGRDPTIIVAGAIYYIAKKRGITNSITQSLVKEKLNVSVVSIRDSYKDIEEVV